MREMNKEKEEINDFWVGDENWWQRNKSATQKWIMGGGEKWTGGSKKKSYGGDEWVRPRMGESSGWKWKAERLERYGRRKDRWWRVWKSKL